MLIKGLRPQGALGFPRGEAVAQIGSSEPIWVTDEERRPASTRCVVGKKGQNVPFPFYFGAYWPEPIAVPHPTRLTPGHLPPGGRYLPR